MIPMALACRPRLLIADEPTTALDVTIQAQILELMKDLQREYKMAIILITHNIGVVAEMADDVVVMYAGRPVEHAAVNDLFKNPKHPTPGLSARSRDRPAPGRTVGDPRARAQPHRPAHRVPVRAPVRGADRSRPHPLPRGDAGAGGGGAGPQGALLPAQ
jgi:ABC-type dipeptide/oligopeptide/nickel transport system ATPase component